MIGIIWAFGRVPVGSPRGYRGMSWDPTVSHVTPVSINAELNIEDRYSKGAKIADYGTRTVYYSGRQYKEHWGIYIYMDTKRY